MNLTDKKKKIDLLNKTVTMFFPEEANITKKSLKTLEVTFSKDKYPALGINLECFENPKLNKIEKIKEFLCDNLNINTNVIIRDENFFKLNYEVKVENEKLVIWKILHYLKPRSFRLLRISLTWPDNNEADGLVKPILKRIPSIIDAIKFNFSKTLYDDLASLEYKLASAKYKNYKFWNIFNLKIPTKWIADFSDNKNFAKIYMNLNKNFHFLIEKFDINLKSSKSENKDKVVEKLIEEITREVSITDAKLKKSENNDYLFYFLAKEKLSEESNIIQNKIWYRIKVLETKIVIISSVFELSSKIELENKIYLEKLDQIIEASEILV